MSVELRGHHLICLHFFKGEVLGQKFAEKMREMLSLLEKNSVKVIEGIDELCKVCPMFKEGKCEYEDEVKEMDRKALELLNLKVGDTISWREVKERVGQVIDKWKEMYCNTCEYRRYCFPE